MGQAPVQQKPRADDLLSASRRDWAGPPSPFDAILRVSDCRGWNNRYAQRIIAYGFRLGNGKKLAPAPHEQKAIALMLELRSTGMPLAKIGEELEGRGFVARNGTRLSAKVIRSVIRRKACSQEWPGESGLASRISGFC